MPVSLLVVASFSPFEVTECTYTYEKWYFKSGPNRAFTEAGGDGVGALGVAGVEGLQT